MLLQIAKHKSHYRIVPNCTLHFQKSCTLKTYTIAKFVYLPSLQSQPSNSCKSLLARLPTTKWRSQKDFNTIIYYSLAWLRSHLMLHLLSTLLTNTTSQVQEDSMHKNTGGGCFGNLSFWWVSRLANLWFSFGWYPCLVQHVVLCFTQTRDSYPINCWLYG